MATPRSRRTTRQTSARRSTGRRRRGTPMTMTSALVSPASGACISCPASLSVSRSLIFAHTHARSLSRTPRLSQEWRAKAVVEASAALTAEKENFIDSQELLVSSLRFIHAHPPPPNTHRHVETYMVTDMPHTLAHIFCSGSARGRQEASHARSACVCWHLPLSLRHCADACVDIPPRSIASVGNARASARASSHRGAGVLFPLPL